MATFLGILFILVCILLIAIILLQKGRGGGLSGAFGGAGGHSAFGSRTGDMFTWITVVLIGLFLLVGSAAVRVFIPPHATPTSDKAALETTGEETADTTAETSEATTDDAAKAVTDGEATAEDAAASVPVTPATPATPEVPSVPAESEKSDTDN